MKLTIIIYMMGISLGAFAKEAKTENIFEHKIEENEDAHVLQESVKLFGPPRPLNYENCDLPGLELALDDEKLSQKDFFKSDDSGNYTLKLRAIAENFSYNDHYEVGQTTAVGNEKVFIIQGQFAEKFQRKNGGYYLRTIGYVRDKEGYRLFLVDVSRVVSEKIRKHAKVECGKRRRRSPLSPCLLASLVG